MYGKIVKVEKNLSGLTHIRIGPALGPYITAHGGLSIDTITPIISTIIQIYNSLANSTKKKAPLANIQRAVTRLVDHKYWQPQLEYEILQQLEI
jgi:hypothetical protein